jgi:hypothetical protein
MVERLVILAATMPADEARARLGAAGGQVLQAYGTRVWLVDLSAEGETHLADDPAILGVFAEPVPDDTIALDETERVGIAAWNLRQTPSFRATRAARRGEGRSWGDSVEPEG